MTNADLTPAERELVDCYHRLLTVLAEHRDELAPFEERNAAKATAALWQVVNGLDLDPGHIYHVGV